MTTSIEQRQIICISRTKEPKTKPAPRMEDADFHVPHFQRISTSGEDCTGVPIEDLKSASEMLVKAIAVRQKYMKVSKQQFPSFGERFLAAYRGEVYQKPRDVAGKASLEGEQIASCQ